MNRPIKFRAWDSVKKVMVTDFYKQAANTAGFLDDTGRMMEDGRHEYMQFTGLTDKNGKEIYEGDILRTTDIPELPPKIEVQRWVNELACFSVCSVHDMEVIGNIYENPDLLEK